jgi:hypothetical protein
MELPPDVTLAEAEECACAMYQAVERFYENRIPKGVEVPE